MDDIELDLRNLDYVSAYDDNLTCPICRSAFVEPVVVSDCEHHFCRDCLQRTHTWSQYSGTCPTCRQPGRLNGRGCASKLLVNILDDLLVKCPNQTEGCAKDVKRSQVVDHVNLYCQHAWVQCRRDDCHKKVQRKDADQCVHQPVSCLACRQPMTLADLESHWLHECPDHDVPCPSCATTVLYRSQRSHLDFDCLETEASCPAKSFGCPYSTKRKHLPQHTATCSLAQLAPYLSAQKTRQDEQDMARQLLENKYADLQTDFAQLKLASQPPLFSRPSPTSPHSYFPSALPDFELPFPTLPGQDSQPYASPTQHLLSLHENLREEVSRQANTIHEVDARLSMMLMNENMRLKEELTYQGAQLSALMRQVGWLTNARLQGLQGMATSAAVNHDVQRPSDSSRIPPRMPVRRTTDEGRTKL